MEDINNKEIYLTKMSKTFFDKAWFMSHIPEGIDTFIDLLNPLGPFVLVKEALVIFIKVAVFKTWNPQIAPLAK